MEENFTTIKNILSSRNPLTSSMIFRSEADLDLSIKSAFCDDASMRANIAMLKTISVHIG